MREIFKPENWMVNRQPFQPEKWLSKTTNNKKNSRATIKASDLSVDEKVEIVLSRIERSHTDITTERDDWVTLGYSLATEFGETGRGYFHRLSRLYANYNWSESDRLYTGCIKSNRFVVTINTFFWMAREAGIDIRA